MKLKVMQCLVVDLYSGALRPSVCMGVGPPLKLIHLPRTKLVDLLTISESIIMLEYNNRLPQLMCKLTHFRSCDVKWLAFIGHLTIMWSEMACLEDVRKNAARKFLWLYRKFLRKIKNFDKLVIYKTCKVIKSQVFWSYDFLPELFINLPTNCLPTYPQPFYSDILPTLVLCTYGWWRSVLKLLTCLACVRSCAYLLSCLLNFA